MKEKDLDKALWITLNEIGFPHNLKGRNYIKEAVKIVEHDIEKANHIVKDVYIPIAQCHDETPSSVERAIRHSIEVSWTRGNQNAIGKIFGYTFSSQKGKPTNSELIYLLCDFIKLFGEDILNGNYKF